MKGLKKAVEMMNSMKVFGATAVEIHYLCFYACTLLDKTKELFKH